MGKSTLLEFPCEFPIKAMGRSNSGLAQRVLALVQEEAPEVTMESLRVSDSRNGNYESVTITIQARSKEQLDRIYLALTACEAVLMAL